MYKIRYTPLAREDMLEILTYVSEELFAQKSAVKLLDKIETDILRLRENPYSGPIARDKYLVSQGIRYLVSGKYLILYKVDDASESVIVYRVVYGSRNLAFLFPEISDKTDEENRKD